MATLYIFSGLPGVGKSTLAKRLAQETMAVYLRIDTLEQAIRELCDFEVEGEGYRTAYRIASDNLELGTSVVADCCNPIPLTRREWKQVAVSVSAAAINIEVRCSNLDEHRYRVESRRAMSNSPELLPTWDEVLNRHFVPSKQDEAILVDTASKSLDECYQRLQKELRSLDSA